MPIIILMLGFYGSVLDTEKTETLWSRFGNTEYGKLRNKST